MSDTGRISRGVTPTARRILLDPGDADRAAELGPITDVDRAHLVMLAERGLVTRARAAALLGEIARLRETGFAPLHGRPAPRGLYLLYEGWLIDALGPDTGGVLHTGRSRNDLNATTLRLRLRAPYHALLREALRLQAVLLRRARRHADVVMPLYTHGQPALPGTYGHFLCGVATALGRDVRGLLDAAAGLDACPLGAGAVGGTTLAIDPARTAALLGFRDPVAHSVDAVASRDFVLRILSAAAILAVTMSRLAADLLAWTAPDRGLLALPDTVVGSSSMMPQKRNPFLLEHVQGRAGAALGAFVHAASAMQSAPFTNHIAVGTEAVAPVADALRTTAQAATLARLVAAAAAPRPDAMRLRAEDGFTAATELANRLVVEGGMPFRAAHHRVGQVVRDAERAGEPLADAAARALGGGMAAGLDAASIARASEYGGGPGPASFAAAWTAAHRGWAEAARATRLLAARWSDAAARLDDAASALMNVDAPPAVPA